MNSDLEVVMVEFKTTATQVAKINRLAEKYSVSVNDAYRACLYVGSESGLHEWEGDGSEHLTFGSINKILAAEAAGLLDTR